MKLLKIELIRGWSEIKSYYPDYIVGFFVNVFILILVTNNSSNFNLIYFGYISWVLSSGVIAESAMTISTEKQLGTLQNLMTKTYDIYEIIIAKNIVWYIFNFIKIMLISIIIFFLRKSLVLYFSLILVLIVEFFGILGLSLVMAALTLKYTKIASFETIISFILLYLSGSVYEIPRVLIFSNPISLGYYSAEKIYNSIYSIEDFILLFFVSLIWFIVGFMACKYLFNNKKQIKWTY